MKVTISLTVNWLLTNQIAPVEQANQIGVPTKIKTMGWKSIVLAARVLALIGGLKLSRLLGPIAKGLGHLNTRDRFLKPSC